MSVAFSARLSLIMYPVTLLFYLGFMKVWAQESFPTLLRTTAQGSIVAVARFTAGIAGMFTASLIAYSPRGAYVGLAVLVGIGFAFAIWGFHGKQRNEFVHDDELEAVQTTGAAGTVTEQPAQVAA